MNTVNHTQTFSLDELCALTDLTKRTVRYYVQIGLVNRPEGETRAAKYSPQHLEQLLLVKKWTAAGVSLDRIRELLQGGSAPVPERGRVPGSIEVCSHLHVADGVELVIEPTRAGLTPEQLRHFVRAVMSAYEQINQDSTTKANQ
ncbi:MAG: MerR family transcriptional regulator [Alcaligenaceae bacterium]|jgi:DNA-binding transcriptional MerR regulator|nr:MerR family transcriptional regulator [Alcaligenaceae bacterium]